jgi:hypothetical protein
MMQDSLNQLVIHSVWFAASTLNKLASSSESEDHFVLGDVMVLHQSETTSSPLLRATRNVKKYQQVWTVQN